MREFISPEHLISAAVSFAGSSGHLLFWYWLELTDTCSPMAASMTISSSYCCIAPCTVGQKTTFFSTPYRRNRSRQNEMVFTKLFREIL